jgi:hypothetical protein
MVYEARLREQLEERRVARALHGAETLLGEEHLDVAAVQLAHLEVPAAST